MEHSIFKQFEHLRSTMLIFARELNDQAKVQWLAPWHGLGQSATIEDILFDLWYHEDQDGRETRVYPGLIGLTRQQFTYANEINIAKDTFRSTIAQIKELDKANWREIQGRLARRYQALNDQMSREGLNRLHLKQVFRHLPLVVSRPEKVGFSWYTSGRSIKKTSKQQAYELLCKLNTDSSHIRIQLERLASLSDDEPLARVQKQAPILRANLIFADKKRRSLNVSLPLLFPHEGKGELPEFNVPPIEPPPQRTRLVRSDNRIDDDAFLPSIRVHRYASAVKRAFY
ncbi:conserved hypothetical protein, DNA replication terminus site-binding protein domain protein [Reinekea forsetii]|uniref:DNA replication terminus site-binding protein n=2 Tax=Reinekea forsetii TaxID=1336806 RepID=A0A2K8KQ32_9GAMM|nr:conserved hypothetical protein, DNA replication terminus site-binding protein domain protein [Reinekea forsetii]